MNAPIELADLQQILAEQWGIAVASSAELGGELDRTFRVVGDDGQTYCVKTRIGGGEDVDLELAVITHLAGAPEVNASTLVAAVDGRNCWRDGDLCIWVLNWLDGQLWAEVPWRPPALCREFGRAARSLSLSLGGFDHPAAYRSHHWDLRRIDESIEQHRDEAETAEQQHAVTRVLSLVEDAAPVLASLPHSVVHQDLNDHNVLASIVDGQASFAGVIDFGDVLHTATITELAVAVAYAMLRTEYPLDSAADVVAGWYGDDESDDDELSVIFPLALGRLMVNALTWSARREAQPEYADARSRHTWETILKLVDMPERFAQERFRTACAKNSLSPSRSKNASGTFDEAKLPKGAKRPTSTPASLLLSECDDYRGLSVIDLDPRQPSLDSIDPSDPDAVWSALRQTSQPDAPFAIRHNTVRADRSAHADGSGGPATVQLGVELHVPAGQELAIPVAGIVVEASDTRLVIAHGELCSVWSGVASAVTSGDRLEARALLGTATSDPVGVQLLTFAPAVDEFIPSFVRPIDRDAWTALSIDPAPFLGLADAQAGLEPVADDVVRELRNERLAASQRYYYQEPMTLVRAKDVTFFDTNGHRYLDAINNVTHVGHGNDRVVEAAAQQLRRLNTNSRFVYEQMGAYADRLAALLPDPLNVVFLVCTGSEANDLALRISRQVTGREDIMVVDGAYHGNTTAVTGISPNRYKGPGGEGPPPTTHEVEQPNQYRGRFAGDADSGTKYADSVREVAEGLVADGRPPAALIAESLMGTAGQVVYPQGYLAEAFAAVRGVGGLCISDEVQVGFGRLGTDFWGFQQGGVVPDIVTMGKPMGNGQPMAAVVTTREIADAFDQGMKYFNTFGGNPVSCAIANAVLDEIEERELQEHALQVGASFLAKLRDLMDRHERIGDVRGEGLYLGVEFVRDRDTKEPNASLTSAICERMRERGVIVYPNGVHGNCLKIKPPMTFTDDDADRFVETLEVVLHELPAN